MKAKAVTEAEMAPLRVASLPTRPTAPAAFGASSVFAPPSVFFPQKCTLSTVSTVSERFCPLLSVHFSVSRLPSRRISDPLLWKYLSMNTAVCLHALHFMNSVRSVSLYFSLHATVKPSTSSPLLVWESSQSLIIRPCITA